MKFLRSAPLLLLAAACSGTEPPIVEPTRDGGTSGRDAGTVVRDGGNPDEFEWPVETTTVSITPSAFWKNRIEAPTDPFRNVAIHGGPEIRWIKFAVLMRDPSKVYFQDSREYRFHYDFATAHLDPFQGSTRDDFNRVALYEEGQEVILGAVLFAPSPDTPEVGIQLVRQDAYHPEMVRIVFELVRGAIDGPNGMRSFYMPTLEQTASAEQWRTWFAERGVEVSSVSRWGTTLPCHATGWALGKLVYVEGTQIEEAYRTGALTANDILVTDAVPAEIPVVAGVLSRTPSTPSSHVAILARSYGIPFAAFPTEAEADAAIALAGKQVAMSAYDVYPGCRIRLIDVDGNLGESLVDEILALKAPPQLAIQAKQSLGELSRSVDDLTEADIVYFGGKAANFGILRDVIPDRSPPEALALSFDLWDRFMAQTMPSQKTLAQEIDDRLRGLSWPADITAIDAALQEIRDMIERDADFSEADKTAIMSALSGFDANKKIRFRSSTNVEDSDQFSGAGLYSSYSGCIADDTDADDIGPSRCDETRAKERGVFRAIRKVFASFYNDNAYVERVRHGVVESQVGMAVLVHYSFPDEIEMANGVAVVDRTAPTWMQVELVTQPGAVSVTNPENGAPPEVARAFWTSNSPINVNVESYSSLVQLGTTVLESPGEYQELVELFAQVANEYATRNSELPELLLDFEYKKVEPGDIVVKQVRRIPQPARNTQVPTFLIDAPVELCTFQGEYDTVFSMHRNKSRWNVRTVNTRLDTAGVQSSLLAQIDAEYLHEGDVVVQSGSPSTWPGASHQWDGMLEATIDSFTHGAGAEQVAWSLQTQVRQTVSIQQNPLFTLSDLTVYVNADYATPRATIDWQGVGTTMRETARLTPCTSRDDVTAAYPRHEETITGANGLTITTALFWPPPPTGPTAGYTAPLVAWDETTITGLTSNPIVLRGWWSQSYRPEHHNFGSNFIFDPWLEEGIDEATLTELTNANVRFIYAASNMEIWIMGLDGELRLHQ